MKDSRMLKKLIGVILMTSASLLLTGCVILGDSVITGTTKPVQVVVNFESGHEQTLNLQPGMHWGVRRKSIRDQGERFRKVTAYSDTGKEISAFSAEDIPNRRGKYGTSRKFLIL
ncbi:MAG: hypothetical protein ACK4UN_22095, partial [Limisphaerales bacterium]